MQLYFQNSYERDEEKRQELIKERMLAELEMQWKVWLISLRFLKIIFTGLAKTIVWSFPEEKIVVTMNFFPMTIRAAPFSMQCLSACNAFRHATPFSMQCLYLNFAFMQSFFLRLWFYVKQKSLPYFRCKFFYNFLVCVIYLNHYIKPSTICTCIFTWSEI